MAAIVSEGDRSVEIYLMRRKDDSPNISRIPMWAVARNPASYLGTYHVFAVDRVPEKTAVKLNGIDGDDEGPNSIREKLGNYRIEQMDNLRGVSRVMASLGAEKGPVL